MRASAKLRKRRKSGPSIAQGKKEAIKKGCQDWLLLQTTEKQKEAAATLEVAGKGGRKEATPPKFKKGADGDFWLGGASQ